MTKTVVKKIIGLVLSLGFGCLILGVNLFLVRPWLSGDGPANIGSIEVSYVTMAKELVSNWPHLSWWPSWYLGFPFHLFYTPLLPVLIAVLKVKAGLSYWAGYRLVTGLGFALAPVSLFFLVLYLSRSRLAALASGLLYSIMPSVFYFILPSGEVRQDQFPNQMLDPRRLVVLARWGEGPHTLSLVFLPLAVLFFIKSLRKKSSGTIILSAFFIALTALTNAVGLYALVLFLGAAFVIHFFFGSREREAVLGRTAMAALFAYGLASFWYNFSFITNFFGESGSVLTNWLRMFPWGWLVFGAGGLILLTVLKKFVSDRGLAAVLIWTLVLFAVVGYYYLSAPPEFSEERVELAPQALRYVTEVDMGLAALVGLLIPYLFKKLVRKNKFLGTFPPALLHGLISFVCLSQIFSYAPRVKESLEARADLDETIEVQLADWLKDRVSLDRGERVFIAGNPAFYLDYFTDVWQLRGGLFQAMTHYWPEHVYYQLRFGKSQELMLAWLRAINAEYAVVVPGGEIAEPDKFRSLELEENYLGSKIYRVRLANSSLVKIVDLGEMAGLGKPKKADDKEAIFAYADWLGRIKTQGATFERVNNNLYQIKARVGEGEGILVQMTRDSGWRATSPQGKIKIRSDPMDFFVLVPTKAGEYEITLEHRRTVVIWLGYLVTLATLVGAVGFLFKRSQEVGRE